MAAFFRRARLHPGSFVRGTLHAVFITVFLQLAGSVFRTGKTVLAVVRQQQVEHRPASRRHALAPRADVHSFFDFCIAGGRQPVHSVRLHDAHAAGADLIGVLQITQGRDFDSRLRRSLEDRRAFLRLYRYSVDDQVYHKSLPPFMTPHPKWSQRRQRPASCIASS